MRSFVLAIFEESENPRVGLIVRSPAEHFHQRLGSGHSFGAYCHQRGFWYHGRRYSSASACRPAFRALTLHSLVLHERIAVQDLPAAKVNQ
jgi:hypothetical protein